MKVLLATAVLQLLYVPVLLLPAADEWEKWGPYGECSRSCGSGVTMRTRKCATQRTDGGNNCVGPDKSYRSCNIQDCPEGSRDFREEQCSQFDGSDFQGKRYKWFPYYGAENPCELNCMPRGENFFYRHRASVVDGTPCHPGGKDVCVDGVCKRLGCDNMLESPQQEDPCLQCGGSGESCTLVRTTFSMGNLPKGYNQMLIIPVGATTIRIRETVATRNYLAVKNLRGEYYLNGHWVIDFSRAAPIAGTMLYYQRGAEGSMAPETITGRGPTTEPLVIELISQEPNQGVEFEYYLPTGLSREGYYWSHGSWSQCSKECGSGYQSRLVFCTIDNEAYPDYLCAALPRPLSNRTCNPQQCPQTQRMAYLYRPQLWRPSESPRTYVYSWKMGEWTLCSASCGGGTQIRSVQCVSHETSGSRVVEDLVCSAYAPRPLSLQPCNQQQCTQYSASNWSPCSVTCGAGEQTREVVCVGDGGVRLQDFSCRLLLRPARLQPCQMPPCQRIIGWHVGDWGLCSKSCGSGLRERQVICSDRERNLYGVELCSGTPKPSTVERCNTQACSSPQGVPSMQDPRGHDNTLHGFLPYIPDYTTVRRSEFVEPPQINILQDPQNSSPGPYCTQSYYGCCPDGYTPARGPQGQGCPQACTQSSFGCCQDGVTVALGPSREGCQEYVPPSRVATPPPAVPSQDCQYTTYGCCPDQLTSSEGSSGEGCPRSGAQPSTCSLPHAVGPCSDWTARYYYDPATSDCVYFWYGGCHGNRNNFVTEAECERACKRAVPVESEPGRSANRARDMRRIFTVYRSSNSRGRQGTSALQAGSPLGPRRAVLSPVQHTLPVASSISKGVSIDQSDPSTVEGRVGQTVVLPCRVTPPPSSTIVVEWRRDGLPLTTSRHRKQPNGSLLVGPLTLQDSGWLLCVATHDTERDHRYIYLSVSKNTPEIVQDSSVQLNGDDLYQPVTPQVPPRGPPRFSIDPSGSSLVEGRAGQTGRLYCRVRPFSVAPSVSIRWTRGGQPLNSLRHTQHSDGTLQIGQLSSEDSGIYTCTASGHHQVDQRQIQLKVLGGLKITTAPNNVQVAQGSTAQLPCVVSGDNVSVGWSRNGVPVRPDGGRVQVSSDGTLILNNVQPVDEGSYTCNAYTGTYSVSATAEVRVSKTPRQELDADLGVPPECVDQPELANCQLIVYARLCSNQYYSSFCCASCARHAQGGKIGTWG